MINTIKASRLSTVPDSAVFQGKIMKSLPAKADEPGMNNKKKSISTSSIFFSASRSFAVVTRNVCLQLTVFWCFSSTGIKKKHREQMLLLQEPLFKHCNNVDLFRSSCTDSPRVFFFHPTLSEAELQLH